jgi:predicted component of type VI protein secretion system
MSQTHIATKCSIGTILWLTGTLITPETLLSDSIPEADQQTKTRLTCAKPWDIHLYRMDLSMLQTGQIAQQHTELAEAIQPGNNFQQDKQLHIGPFVDSSC